MKRPSFQFYPADWRKDLALRKCSLAARGMWVELMCIAHECEPYGTLRHNGEALQAEDIAGLVGMCSPREAKTLIEELVRKGVAKVDDAGVIYSKRMVQDEELRNRRASGGVAGAEHGQKGAEHGAKGGRPKRDEGGLENTPSEESRGVPKPPLKPPPSSSSSSSEELPDGAKAPSSSAEPTKPASKATPEIPPPYDAIVDAYHEVLPELPRVLLRTGKAWEKRRRAMTSLWRFVLTSTRSDGARRATNGPEAIAWIREYFARARSSDWLMGRTPPGKGHEGWRCDFDFLLSDAGMKAVIERTEVAA